MSTAPPSEREIDLQDIEPLDIERCFIGGRSSAFTPLGTILFKIHSLASVIDDPLNSTRRREEIKEELDNSVLEAGLDGSEKGLKTAVTWATQLHFHIQENIFHNGKQPT